MELRVQFVSKKLVYIVSVYMFAFIKMDVFDLFCYQHIF